MYDDRRSPAPRGSRGARPLVVAALVAVFGAGIGVGWLAGTLPGGDGGVSAPVASGDSGSVAPVHSSVPDEPVAVVAAALLPSIVQIETPSGLGSGVIYDADGLILTASHVVAGETAVSVRLANGDRMEGRVIGDDPDNDIAVVGIDRTGLPAAPLALREELRVGQLAIAIGSPWGLESTVTSGVVSAVDRPIDGPGGVRTMIQTDASINPGNSGGALADRQGRVIGINVSIFSSTGANDGVGFSVPVARAYRVAQVAVSGGTLQSAFLGIRGEDNQLGAAGAVVVEVLPDTPAAGAGIAAGDRIVSVGGRPVHGILDLAAIVREHEAGDRVEVGLVRDGRTLSLEVTLGVPPADS